MGCDIHITVEVRNAAGAWEALPNPVRDCYFCVRNRRPGDPPGPQADCRWCNGTGKGVEEWYDGRNYALFAILADVRNDEGGYRPIAPPRGVPTDASPEYLAEVEAWEGDGHSHTYHTLAEILAYDWDAPSFEEGLLSEAGYREMKEKGEPSMWCGDAFGPDIVKISDTEMEMLLAGEYQRKAGVSYHTRAKWAVSAREYAATFLANMEEARVAAGNVKPEDLRVCCFFDN